MALRLNGEPDVRPEWNKMSSWTPRSANDTRDWLDIRIKSDLLALECHAAQTNGNLNGHNLDAPWSNQGGPGYLLARFSVKFPHSSREGI